MEIDRKSDPDPGGYTELITDNVTVINEDILKVDIATAGRREKWRPARSKWLQIFHIISRHRSLWDCSRAMCRWNNITVMVQKEVAERMQAGPGSKDYGALSLAVQYYAEPYIVANVPPNCFMPRPKVGSAVIRLKTYRAATVQVKDEAFLFALIRASFNQRRKTLVNSLKNASDLKLEKEQVLEALRTMGLSETVRGEALTLEQFASLADLLKA